MRNTLLLVTIFTALILTTGCGSGKLATVVVTGTVTLNGVPLDDATVNFSPKVEGQGHPAFAVTGGFSGSVTVCVLVKKRFSGTIKKVLVRL
jgi:hypothetical protein